MEYFYSISLKVAGEENFDFHFFWLQVNTNSFPLQSKKGNMIIRQAIQISAHRRKKRKKEQNLGKIHENWDPSYLLYNNNQNYNILRTTRALATTDKSRTNLLKTPRLCSKITNNQKQPHLK